MDRPLSGKHFELVNRARLGEGLRALQNPQLVKYADEALLASCLEALSSHKALVEHRDVDRLSMALADVQAGNAVALQLGDCAERFEDAHYASVHARVHLYLFVARRLQEHLKRRVIPIGRFAGQFGKPRSTIQERAEDGSIAMQAYRGDIVNDVRADVTARSPDPRRMLGAYTCAARTIAMADEVLSSSLLKDGGGRVGASLYTSHELFLLPFELAMTRQVTAKTLYDLSAHFLWIGERTRSPGGAHIAFAKTIANPLGIKLGPNAAPDDVVQLVRSLNPQNLLGKIVLITRLGVGQVATALPAMIGAVQRAGIGVIWGCDPLHGNSELTLVGLKSRHYANVVSELEQTIRIHARCASSLGLVHLEVTPERVTECIGGPGPAAKEADVSTCYRSACDPRLSDLQTIELIEEICARAGSLWRTTLEEERLRASFGVVAQ